MTRSSSTTSSSAIPVRPKPRRAVTAGLLIAGIAAASIANAVIAFIAHAAGASDDFRPLQAGAFISFTVLGILIGAAGWMAVRRFSAHPRALLTWLVPAVVAVSFVPDLMMFASDYQPHADAAGIIALMVMHVAVAAVAVATYLRALPLNRTPES